MRSSLILSVLLSLAAICFASKANGQIDLNKKINLQLNSAPLEEAMEKLEKSADIQVMVVGNLTSRKFSVNAQQEQLGSVLKKMLTPAELTYKIINNTIVIARTPSVQKPGMVTGKVLDEKGQTLPGATIKVVENGKACISSVDGSYSLSLEPGTYTLEFSFISYQTQRVTGVIISEDRVTSLNISLKQANTSLKEVVVTADFRKASVEGLYARQKNNAVPTDGISTDQIARTPDKNIGEVLKRISGVATVDNKFVVVRGLSERYNQATLNGQALPSTELNRKQFSFDIIPANMVDEITVAKSITADMSAEFGGGNVQVVTKDIPTENFASVTIGGAANDHTTNKNFLMFPLDSRNYLGQASANRNLLGERNWNSLEDITAAGFTKNPSSTNYLAKNPQLFSNNWGLRQFMASPSQNYQAAIGHVFPFKNHIRLGVVASLSYRNTWQNSDVLTSRGGFVIGREFEDTNKGVFPGEIGNNYQFTTNVGGLIGVGLTAPHYKVSLQTLLLNTLDQQELFGFGGLDSGGEGFGLSDNTQQTSLWQNQLKGEYVLGKRGIKLQAGAGYIQLDRQRPDDHLVLAPIVNNDLNNGNPTINSPYSPLFGPLRFWNRAYEQDYNWNADISIPFKFQIGNMAVGNTFKTGYAGWRKDRLLWVLNTASASKMSQTVNGYSAPLNDYFDTNTLMVSASQFGDDYNHTGTLHAGYAMLDQQIGQHLRLVYGMRLEYYDINALNSYLGAYVRLGYTDISEIQKLDPNRHWFPSASLTYNFIKTMNLRLVYAKSIVRPDLRELAQFKQYDFELGGEYEGKSIRSTLIDNLEARYEWFPAPGDIFSVSAFYKKLDHPMEIFDDPNGNRIYTLQNSISAKNRGIEAELRKSLGFTGLPVIKNLTLYGNFTYIDGSVVPQKIGSTGYTVDPQNPHKLLIDEQAGPEEKRLQAGASNYTYNMGVYYTSPYFTASLAYNKVTNRLFRPSFVYPKSLYERPLESLDAQVSFRLPKPKLELKFNVANLLNSSYVVYQNYYADGTGELPGPNDNNTAFTQPTTKQLLYQRGQDYLNYSSKPGRTYSASLTYNF